ncbi:hypothetical protein CR513_30230, partial [Mucuna pruriens]
MVLSQIWLTIAYIKMKDLRDAYFVLKIQILRNCSQGTLGLSHKSYINTVLGRFNMKDSKLRDTPVAKKDKLVLTSALLLILKCERCKQFRSLATMIPILRDAWTVGILDKATSICWLKELFPINLHVIDTSKGHLEFYKVEIYRHQVSCRTNFMLVDPLTKCLTPKVFHEYVARMDVVFEDTLI